MRSSPIRLDRSGIGTSKGVSRLPRQANQGQPASSSAMESASLRRAGSMYSVQVVRDSNRCWSTSMVCRLTCPPGRTVPVVVRTVPRDRGPLRADGAADLPQPGVRRLPRRVGLTPLLGPVLAGSRVRTQELHPRQAGMEVSQAVGHDLVSHMARKVDDEAVVTQRLLRRARLNFAQVDVARRELPEDAVQAPGVVGPLEAHDARLVVPGGGWD